MFLIMGVVVASLSCRRALNHSSAARSAAPSVADALSNQIAAIDATTPIAVRGRRVQPIGRWAARLALGSLRGDCARARRRRPLGNKGGVIAGAPSLTPCERRLNQHAQRG